MCYSLQASITSTITSFITCGILYVYSFNQTKTIHILTQKLSLFFLFVSLMQLYDWIFWKTQDPGNNTNKITTKIAMISNHLQPIVCSYLISQDFNLSSSTKISLVIYTIYALYYSYNIFNKLTYTIVSEKSSPALDWEWNSYKGSTLMYSLFLSTLSLIALDLPYPVNILLLIINIGTWTFSKYQYKRANVGHMWCLMASYIPLLLLVIEYFFKI